MIIKDNMANMCAKVTSTYMEFTLAFGPKLEFSFSFKFLNYDNSLQQNKNTMFDDKEQVFCEEKKNGLLFTGWFTGCVTETLPRME